MHNPCNKSSTSRIYRARHCALQVNSTHAFIAGGYPYPQPHFKDAHLLNWETKAWTRLPDMSMGRIGLMCGAAGGEIVVVGGQEDDALRTSQIYSFKTGMV